MSNVNKYDLNRLQNRFPGTDNAVARTSQEVAQMSGRFIAATAAMEAQSNADQLAWSRAKRKKAADERNNG